MPLLRLSTPEGLQTVEISREPVLLGRSESCDIILRNDAEVSREHARVWIDDNGSIMVQDNGSKNGTRVDLGPPFRGNSYPASRSIQLGEQTIEIVNEDATVADEEVRYAADAGEELGNSRFFPSSHRPDLTNQQRLNLLISLTERIGGVFEKQQLLEQALDACIETLNFERGMIALKAARGETEMPITRNVQKDETGAYKISRTLINRALVDGERAVVNNPATDLVDNLTESLVRFPICSALCVPIVYRDDILGVIYGDRVSAAATYHEEDVDFLAGIAQQVGVGLANLQMLDNHVRSQKVYAELNQARGIQQKLLPAKPLQHQRVSIAGYNQASTSVSGDYYDYFPLDDELIGVVIADVTGHGLPAALLMANFQAAVRVALTAGIPLEDLATRLNSLMFSNTSSSVFVTGILGKMNAETGAFDYISAGHPGPICVTPSGPVLLDAEGEKNALPLGVLPTEEFVVQRYEPPEGAATLLFYTDGLSEAESPQGQLLGVDPVIAKLRESGVNAPMDVLNISLQLVRGHIGDNTDHLDDLTLLAMQIHRD